MEAGYHQFKKHNAQNTQRLPVSKHKGRHTKIKHKNTPIIFKVNIVKIICQIVNKLCLKSQVLRIRNNRNLRFLGGA